ncbi:Sideroflexin-5 [Seminavis robusta]|uniref:Sideroflexin-5 n=1 Tax=Seminavis robusta TaxID=568900 RepID=A0A9N8DQX0_9STRA|nr:Sideroflexin-5 [Seminavis robusta]|eukprot:Sro223_g091350.1 Sideroflexin-5 (500) ;mRNA; f:29530-31029
MATVLLLHCSLSLPCCEAFVPSPIIRQHSTSTTSSTALSALQVDVGEQDDKNNKLKFTSADNVNIKLVPVAAASAASAAAMTIIVQQVPSLDLSLHDNPIVLSLVAAVVGVLTVSSATALLDHCMSTSTVYDSQSEQFDQGTFLGRYCKMLFLCDPRLLLYSQEQVRHYQDMAYGNCGSDTSTRSDTSSEHTDCELWHAKRIADSALNSNGDWIPRPFRMSGYLPYNGPICIAMLATAASSSPSTGTLLFWSWLNQSQNALVNFYNRNTGTTSNSNSKTNSTTQVNNAMLQSYAVAVGSALLVAFALSQYVQTHFEGDQAQQLLRMVSFPSAVVASSLNCFFVRSPELKTGVSLMVPVVHTNDTTSTNSDQNDCKLQTVLPGETSLVAASKGVYTTTASRAILQMPTFFIPPMLMSTPMIQQYLQNDPALQLQHDIVNMELPITTFLLLVSFGMGLPACVGFFPQMMTIQASEVEQQYQDLVDPTTGAPYTEFTFNKGL